MKTRVDLTRLAAEKVGVALDREVAPSKNIIDELNNRGVQRIQDFTQMLIDMDSNPQTPTYWDTDEGLQTRLRLLAHNSVWRDYNDAIAKTMIQVVGWLPTEPEYTFIWTTHPEDSETGPCGDCEDMDGMEFTADEVDGIDINAHPNCVCDWDIDVGEPLGG